MTDHATTTRINSRLRIRHWLVLLWWVAFLPRLGLSLPFLSYPIALDDMFQYDMLARSLIQGQGYRWYSQADVEEQRLYLSQFLDVDAMHVPPQGLLTTFRPPGYPFFLAGIYALGPLEYRFILARLVQVGIGALLAPFAALLALRMGLNRWTSVFAGVGMALYPILTLYPIGLASENLFIPLVLLSVITLLWSITSASPWRAASAGLLLGLTMLTRSVFAPFVLLAFFWMGRYAVARWRSALIMVLVAFGICLPWAIRNSLLHGRPTFLESALGYQLYIGYHPDGDGGFNSQIAVAPLTILDDVERDRQTMQAALEFIRHDPLQIPIRAFQRAVYFFGVEDRELIYFYTNNIFGEIAQPWLTLIYLILILPWIFLGIFAPLGLLQSPHRPAVILVTALVGVYTLPHLFIIAEPRFHLALVPLLMPFAVHGWIERRRAVRHLLHPLRTKRLPAYLARAALLLLAILWVWGFAQRWQTILAVLSPGGNMLYFYY